MLLNQEHGGRLTIRVHVPYSLICKLNTIRKQKRNTRNTIELTNHTKSQNSTLHFICHHIIFLSEFSWTRCWRTWRRYTGAIFLLSASGNEADDPRSLKKQNKNKPKQSFKKIIPVYKQQLQCLCHPEQNSSIKHLKKQTCKKRREERQKEGAA